MIRRGHGWESAPATRLIKSSIGQDHSYTLHIVSYDSYALQAADFQFACKAAILKNRECCSTDKPSFWQFKTFLP